jgi:hypothetical protein
MALLTCPTCGKPFAPGQVNLALGVASCEPCGQVHDLSRRAATHPLAHRTPADPEGLVVVDGESPAVSYAWRGWALLFLVLWCTIWDSAMLVVVGGAVSQGEWEALLFSSLHVAAGLGVTYLTVALAINHTEIRLRGDELHVSHGPLPWWGERLLSRRAIEQIYVIEDRGSKGSRTYSVHARLTPGHPVRLVHGLSSAGRARFLEEWLEKRLGIADAPVSGEHG